MFITTVDVFLYVKINKYLPGLFFFFYLQWIEVGDKCLFCWFWWNGWYIAGSAKCSTKPLSKLLASFLLDVNIELQSSCDTSYSKGGVNQCGFWRSLKIVYSTYSQGPSPAITFKHLTPLPSTQLFPTQS